MENGFGVSYVFETLAILGIRISSTQNGEGILYESYNGNSIQVVMGYWAKSVRFFDSNGMRSRYSVLPQWD
jgi:hypothetical protein